MVTLNIVFHCVQTVDGDFEVIEAETAEEGHILK